MCSDCGGSYEDPMMTAPEPACPECGVSKPDDDRVANGMKCTECAYARLAVESTDDCTGADERPRNDLWELVSALYAGRDTLERDDG